MTKIKSYTDLEQSRKLVEILHIESADLHYSFDLDFEELENVPTITEENDHFILFPKDVPCWSLTALLSVLPTFTIDSSDDHYFRIRCQQKFSEWHNNPIDACVEMIIRLNELKML